MDLNEESSHLLASYNTTAMEEFVRRSENCKIFLPLPCCHQHKHNVLSTAKKYTKFCTAIGALISWQIC